MSLSLLEQIKQKALGALGGIGNALVQDFQSNPIVNNVENIANSVVHPQAQPIPQSQPPLDLAQLFQNVINSAPAKSVINTVSNQNILPPQIPHMKFTVGDAGNVVKPFVDATTDTAKAWGMVPQQIIDQLQGKPIVAAPAPTASAQQGLTNIQDILFGGPSTEVRPAATATETLFNKPVVNAAEDVAGRIAPPAQPAEQTIAKTFQDLLANGQKTVSDITTPIEDVAMKALNDSRNVVQDKPLLPDSELAMNMLKPAVNTADGIATAPQQPTKNLFTPPVSNPVASELNQVKDTIKQTVDGLDKTGKSAKGLFKQAVNATLGNTELKGARGVLAKDSPAGRLAVETVQQAENKVAELAGQAQAKLRQAISPLSDQELTTLADVVEGKAQPISDAQAQAAQVWSGIAQEIHSLASETGQKVGNIENYFPHFSSAKEGQVSLDGRMVGQGDSLGFGSFKERKANGDFVKDPNVLFNYIDGAYKTIVNKAYFGDKAENLYRLAQKTANPGQATQIIQNMLGEGQKGGVGAAVANKITDLQRVGKLGFTSPLTNLTQQISAIARTDLPSAIKSYTRMISNPEQAMLNAVKAHEVDPALGRKALDAMGANPNDSIGSKWLKLIKFSGSEKLNRIFSVNAGMEYAQKLVDQAKGGSGAAVRELQRLGVKDFLNAGEQDIINAGRKVSEATQFSTGNGQLPTGWDSPLGKVATQFKSFAYKQTGFVKDEAIRVSSEAAKGNLKPLTTALATYGVGSALMGEIINDVRSIVTNKTRQDGGGLNRYITDVLSGSSLGLLDNTDALLGKYGPSGVVGAIAGPTIGDVTNAGINATKAAAGDIKPLARQAAKLVPGIGQAISNTLIPNGYVDNQNIGDTNLGVNTGDALANNAGNGAPFGGLFGGGDTAAAGVSPDAISWKSDTGKKISVNLTQKDYSSKGGIAGYKQDTSNINKAVEIWAAPTDQVSDAQKIAAYDKLGVKPDDVRYAYKAKFTTDEKTSYIVDKNLPHDELIKDLVTGRVESLAGDRFAADGVITNLVDQGLISKDEGKQLKKIKIGKDGKLATSSLSSGGGLTQSKIKSYVSAVNTLNKNPISTSKPKSANTVVKKVTAPKLKLSTKKRAKSANQWFTSY